MYTLITGASSGIGYALSKVCASHGHHLILTARTKEILESLSKELQTQYKIKVEVVTLDLSLADSALELYDNIKEKNWNVTILINNAGVGDHGLFVRSKLKRQIEMIQLNISTLTELTHLFLPNMINQKSGFILNVASTASFQPGPFMSVYYATKAYVLSFTEALSEELKGTGVSITALCPGPTISGFQKAANFTNVPILKILNLPSSREVAEYAYKSMVERKVIAVHGLTNQFLIQLTRVFPRFLVRKIVKKLQFKRL